MRRILQLIDLHADFPSERGAHDLKKGLGREFDIQIKTLGAGGDFRHAADAVFQLRRQAGARYDIVHAWGVGAAMVASLVGAGRAIYSPGAMISRRQIRWLRSILSCRSVDVVFSSSTQQRIAVERGVNIDRTRVIRPGVDFSRLNRLHRHELRQELGYTNSDFVLLNVGESTWPAAHQLSIWAGAILQNMDQHVRVLGWGRGNVAEHDLRFAHRLGQNGVYRPAEKYLRRRVEFEELVAVADTAIVSARGQVSTLPICICLAGGVPIVSNVTYTSAEILEDRHNCLMTSARSPRAIAERIVDLRQDDAVRRKIVDTGRSEAYEFYSNSRFLSQWRDLYVS